MIKNVSTVVNFAESFEGIEIAKETARPGKPYIYFN